MFYSKALIMLYSKSADNALPQSVIYLYTILCVALLIDQFVLCVCMFDSVCDLFGETIRNVFGCGCSFVVECYGSV